MLRRFFLAPVSAGALLFGLLLLAPLGASAVPALQLDIEGGTYDDGNEDIVTSDPNFTLYAIGTPKTNAAILGTTFYLSIALTPPTDCSDAVDFGSFEVNGITYDSVDDLVYGVPPIEADGTAAHDAGDLAQHGVFETHFAEQSFTFSASNETATYNTADDPGGTEGGLDESGSGSYFAEFEVDVSGLAAGYGLHFDVYSVKEITEVLRQRGRLVTSTVPATDRDVDLFAPFSHDASTTPVIPEPSAAMVFGASLFVTGWATRRRAA